MCDNVSNIKKLIKRNFIFNLIKTLLIFTIFLFVFAFFNKISILNICYAEGESGVQIEEELEGATGEILEDIDFSSLDEIIGNLNKELNDFGSESFKKYVSNVLSGEKIIGINELFDVVIKVVKSGSESLFFSIILIFVVVLIFNSLSFLRSDKISGVAEIIRFICFSVVVIIISSLVKNVIDKTSDALFSMKRQMDIIFPIMLSLIASMGGVLSVSSFTPVLTFLSNIISSVFVYILMPLFSLSLVLSIVGNISKNAKLEKLNGLLGLFLNGLLVLCLLFLWVFYLLKLLALVWLMGLALRQLNTQ